MSKATTTPYDSCMECNDHAYHCYGGSTSKKLAAVSGHQNVVLPPPLILKDAVECVIVISTML